MFKRVLVPLDGSERAERAIPLAAKIAGASGGAVILARVVATPVEYGPVLAPHLGADVMESELREFADYLTEMAGLPALSGIATETKVLTGSPALTILQTIALKKVDLVVMTSHGRTGLSRWVLGSVAQHIAQSAPVPVLVLREHGPDLIEGYRAAENLRVVVPLDGSSLAEEAIVPAAAMLAALTPRGVLHLTIVLMPFETRTRDMPQALVMDGAKAYLARVAEEITRDWPGLAVGWEIAVGTDPADTIIRITEGKDISEHVSGKGYDAIAMATHGRTGLSHWAFGSVTERVLHGTQLPLLIVRTRQHATKVASEATRASEATDATNATPADGDDQAHEKTKHDRIVDRVPAWPLY
jgi:nucleotide-binding universal stress UspA family protein